MNEWNEIMGDWYEEMAFEAEEDRRERLEALKQAPQPAPITDAELTDWQSYSGD